MHIPRNDCNCLLFLGVGNCWIAFTLSDDGEIPDYDKIKPKNWTSSVINLDLSSFRVILFSDSFCSTHNYTIPTRNTSKLTSIYSQVLKYIFTSKLKYSLQYSWEAGTRSAVCFFSVTAPSSDRLLLLRARARLCFCVLRSVWFNLLVCDSVSYTHLDVYKRQPLIWVYWYFFQHKICTDA